MTQESASKQSSDSLIYSDYMVGVVNVAKTKYMVIRKNTIPNVDRLYINNSPLETVEKIKYLGSTVNEKWDHSAEIRQRIEIARDAFQRDSTWRISTR